MFGSGRKISFLPWLIAGLATAFIAMPASAETIPASVAACASETDSLRRLVCYDREVAKYLPSAAARIPGSSGAVAGSDAAATKSAPPAVPAPVQGAAATSASAAPVTQTPADARPAGTPRHLSAHVTRIESNGERIVVFLDNSQVWEQIQEASAEIHLKAGDTVTIDRSLGYYWLSGRDGVAVKVRLRN